ncbi:MAG: hypothetical protein FWC97_03235 [Treponema sp.]|nr:hypothetical protein [Treponema sp.]
MKRLTEFAWGIIVGFLMAVVICGTIVWLVYVNYKTGEALRYVEKQVEIEVLRENYLGRDVDEFLDIPDVRRAADGAADEFIRTRDEILQRFRAGIVDR